MKTFLTLALLVTIAKAQTKNDLAVYGLSFVAGVANGYEEVLKFHYNKGFARVHPNASRQFWDPRVSWHNKNRNAITKVIPTFSDGYHLTRDISRLSLIAAIAISRNDFKGKNKGWKIAKKFVISLAVNRLGQFIVYDWIYREKI